MNLKEKINSITSNTKSNWREKAVTRKNSPWLRLYSSEIARRIISIIKDDNDWNQEKLAENLKVTPQYISKIVKGQENLTLETIFKLSEALDYQLITFPEFQLSKKSEIKSYKYDTSSKELKTEFVFNQDGTFFMTQDTYYVAGVFGTIDSKMVGTSEKVSYEGTYELNNISK